MDGPSQDVASFLGTLQDVMKRLGTIWGHYLRRGTHPSRPFLTLSGRPFTIHEAGAARRFLGCVAVGLSVTGADSKEYELTVSIQWNEERWTISTEAWVEGNDGGQHLSRQLTERSASDLGACLEQVMAAVEDLVSFEDLMPAQ
jgi:hypothetical protein